MSEGGGEPQDVADDVCPIHGPDCSEKDTETCLFWAAW